MEPPRRLLAAAAEGGKIYTFGGCGSPCFEPPIHTSTDEETRVQVYDPAKNAWEEKQRMSAILFGAAAATVKPNPNDDPKIYTFGGYVTPTLTQEYDPVHDSWRKRRPMPTPRHGLAAVAFEDKVYVLGGSNGISPASALEIYEPKTDTWTRGAPMPTARVFLAAVELNGKIYAIGGSPDCCGKSQTNAVEIYDPASDSWTAGVPLPVAEQTSAAAALNGKIYVFGGFIPGSGVQKTTFEYDPETRSWSTKAEMLMARDQAPAVVVDGDVYVLGGAVDCHCRALGDNERFTPGTELGCLSISKTDHRNTVCPRDALTYEITVRNDQGLGPVNGATVLDDFASISQLRKPVRWTCTASGRASCSSSSGTTLRDQVNLPAGGEVHYFVHATVAANASGSIENTVQVTPPPGVTDPSCNHTKTDITKVQVTGDLGISFKEGPAKINQTGMATYLVEVTHSGAAIAGAVVKVEVAGGTPQASPPCTVEADSFTCNINDFPTTLTLNVRPPQGCPCPSQPITLVATVAAAVKECNEDNNSDSITTAVTCKADLAIEKTIDKPNPSLVDKNEPIPYTLNVKNNGPDYACGVEVRDTLEGNIVIPTTPGSCELKSPNGVVCPGANFEVKYSVPQSEPCGTKISNTATVTAVTTDPNPDNNSAMAMTKVGCCDLAISKTDGLTEAMPGDSITYEITAQNVGNVDVFKSTVTDMFPAQLNDVHWCRDAGAPCTPTTPGDLFDTLDLTAGAMATYRAQGTVNAMFTGTLTNTAFVKEPPDCKDLNQENNSSTDTTEITCTGVKALCKSISGSFIEGGMITYTFVLLNCGPAVQMDNPGDEFKDTLPASLTQTPPSPPSSGTTTTAGNTAKWNGSIPVGGMVTITVNATINPGTTGTTICNQAMIAFDADGDGINESATLSDDPNEPGPADPCCFRVRFLSEIPVLSIAGLLALALLLAAFAVLRLSRHSP